MSTESIYWWVSGEVLDHELRIGIPGLYVELFDQDKNIDQRLGSAMTHAQGDFALSFRREDFQTARYKRDAIKTKPDLFCRVWSKIGEPLAQTEVRHEAGRKEVFIILVDKSPEHTRVRFKTDLTILTRANDTLTVIARRYYRLETKGDAGTKKKLKAVIARLKEVNSILADFRVNSRIKAGTEITIARVPGVTSA